ncbi:unnamed protein product [Clonostachys solani]|uniref:Inhibitor I9 domain-containing protein n=1 Tax=Clonostachys solani TaxID=160281 RepID=A0A9N9ZFR3_9HYPO|nr:unnamed protein product [Clonostachys solani]
MGDATVKRIRDDPSVTSVNAVGYIGKNESLMEVFSPTHEYMVIMDPRSKMDVWTHAQNVTKRWITKHQVKDGKLFEGATSFYDDALKVYSGYFDPETIERIKNDENVSESKHKTAQYNLLTHSTIG